jgi:hypothetical protein
VLSSVFFTRKGPDFVGKSHARRGTRPLPPLDDKNRRMALMTPPWALDLAMAYGRHRENPLRSFHQPGPRNEFPVTEPTRPPFTLV